MSGSKKKKITAAFFFFETFFCTLAKVGERLQDAPPESCHGVLHAGAQTEHALEVGLLQQQLPVRHELVRPAQQGGDAVHKLRHEARVRVVGLAVVVGHNLEDRGTQRHNGYSFQSQQLKKRRAELPIIKTVALCS